MPLSMHEGRVTSWQVNRIAVVGPGIVGMPMAAMLAHARIREGGDQPAHVVVVQRNSPTSGWKVPAINEGRSPIGGVEPGLDQVVRDAVAAGLLSASHDYTALADADVVLVSVQTDRRDNEPDYRPLFEALDGIAAALATRPAGNVPLVVFESTLAPSSMTTVIREHFARHGLVEGRDVLLGNSPNRVMPGRLVERVAESDKIIAGLHPETPALIRRLYARIVTRGALHETNSMTAEIVKTLENAYRDVRIAYAAEVARHCDEQDIDFFVLRDQANERLGQEDAASGDPQAVPSGALLVPMLGVGGHCLPKDGILLWWRALEAGLDTSRSLILEARRVNDGSPAATLALGERALGSFTGKRLALLGAAYRGNSEDTRNAPTLQLATLLRERGTAFTIHDPYVHERDANLAAYGVTPQFTRDLAAAVRNADILVLCAPHKVYAEQWRILTGLASRAVGVLDACNLLTAHDAGALRYAGIGRGRRPPTAALVEAAVTGFRIVEAGVAREVASLVEFLNTGFARKPFETVRFADVRRLAATCPTGCRIAPEDAPLSPPPDLTSRLVARALGTT